MWISGFFARMLLVLLIMLMTLSALMTTIRAPHAVSHALDGFVAGCEGIAQPCWYGIVPGVTAMADADMTLKNLGYLRNASLDRYAHYTVDRKVQPCDIELYSRYQVPEIVGDLYMQHCDHITLYPLMLAVGQLDGYVLTGDSSLWMRMADGRIAIESHERGYIFGWLSDTSISRVWLFDVSLSVDYAWHGFITHEQYCELENDLPHCP